MQYTPLFKVGYMTFWFTGYRFCNSGVGRTSVKHGSLPVSRKIVIFAETEAHAQTCFFLHAVFGRNRYGPGDDTTTSGAWREHFFRWMISNGWVTE